MNNATGLETSAFSLQFRQKEKKIVNEVIFQGFHRQKWKKIGKKSPDFYIWLEECVAMNIESWLKRFVNHIWFIARFG